jgi:hypothetical protein
MPIEVYGLRQTLTELKKVEPTLYKKISQDLISGASELTQATGREFPQKPLKNWHTSGDRRGYSRMPPYNGASASRGVKAKVLTRGVKSGILRIEQTNAGGQVLDAAGGKSAGRFVMNLDKHLSTKSKPPKPRSRVLYGGVARHMGLVEDRIREVIKSTEKYIQVRITKGLY